MGKLKFYLSHNKDQVTVFFLIWLMFTLMFVQDAFGDKDYFVERNLLYIWDFEDSKHYETDKKINAEAFIQGKVKWVPPEFSFKESGVIHLHGDKEPASFFMIPSVYTNHTFTNWTLDFEFAIGTHALDHEDHVLDQGSIMDGEIVEWGDLKVTYFVQDDGWRGKIIVEYRQRTISISNVSAFDYHHLVLRSEDHGVSIWVNTRCVDYIQTPRTSMESEKIMFAFDGFAGRLDNVKLYNAKLEPWEISENYWGETLNINKREKLVTSWGELKSQY